MTTYYRTIIYQQGRYNNNSIQKICNNLCSIFVYVSVSMKITITMRLIYGSHSTSLSGRPFLSELLDVIFNSFLPPSIAYSTPSPIFDPTFLTACPMLCELNVSLLTSTRIVEFMSEHLVWSTMVKSNGFTLLDAMRLRTWNTNFILCK